MDLVFSLFEERFLVKFMDENYGEANKLVGHN